MGEHLLANILHLKEWEDLVVCDVELDASFFRGVVFGIKVLIYGLHSLKLICKTVLQHNAETGSLSIEE
jgi:hypothetical protein